jgi:hypothetical protein
MLLNQLEVWNKLPLNDHQRQDLLKSLIEENTPKSGKTMVKLDQTMPKLQQTTEIDLVKRFETLGHEC